MQKHQRKEIKNFNYFVQYIKELIFKNKEKYQLEAIGEIEFSVPKIFNSKKNVGIYCLVQVKIIKSI